MSGFTKDNISRQITELANYAKGNFDKYSESTFWGIAKWHNWMFIYSYYDIWLMYPRTKDGNIEVFNRS
jgi:hypothetical protein